MKGRLLRIENWENLAQNAKFQPALMADLCPITLRNLERFFRDNFNTTPARYARELRCRLARQLISQGWSNKAVVEELGFGNAAHLCHEFKKIYGVSPQNFAPVYGGNVVIRLPQSANWKRAS
jgi:transcriptional regulator GlxA family with amidase domain